jgi:ammonia channel protein AmtB
MDTNAVLDLMWVLICGILVFFMQAGFTLVETGFTRSKNTGYNNNEKFNGFCIGSVAFWAIGYLNVWNFNRLCHRNSKLVLIAQLICIVCSFKLYLLQLLQQLFLVLLLREQNSRPIDILFIDDFTYLSNFW